MLRIFQLMIKFAYIHIEVSLDSEVMLDRVRKFCPGSFEDNLKKWYKYVSLLNKTFSYGAQSRTLDISVKANLGNVCFCIESHLIVAWRSDIGSKWPRFHWHQTRWSRSDSSVFRLPFLATETNWKSSLCNQRQQRSFFFVKGRGVTKGGTCPGC